MSSEPVRTLLDPALVERLRQREVRVRGVVQGALSGRHKSPTHGASVEFAEHQEYAPGDDLRHVDWRAFGRLDRIYLKRFEERTELRAMLVVDASRSMAYAGPRARASKLDVAASLAAAFTHVLTSQGDPVGLMTFGGAADLLPPASRPAHVREVESRLARVEAEGETSDLSAAVERASATLGRHGLVVLLSDLYDFVRDPGQVLSWLRRRHEAVVIAISDPDEEDLPWRDPIIAAGLEGGSVQVDSSAVRDAFRAEVERFRASWRRAADESRADLHFVRTDERMEDLVARLFGAPHRREGDVAALVAPAQG